MGCSRTRWGSDAGHRHSEYGDSAYSRLLASDQSLPLESPRRLAAVEVRVAFTEFRGHFTRRRFLSVSALAGAALAAGCASRDGRFVSLREEEAKTLAALCDQIIPADDYPSASQAGVVAYIDLQLARHYRRHRPAYRSGLAQAENISTGRVGIALAASSPEQQLFTAQTLEKQNPRFFDLLREHTMEGYYGSPRHGGNRDAVSWRMLGLAEPPLRGRFQSSPKASPTL